MEIENQYNNFVYDWWKNLDKLIFFLFISLIILGLFFSLVSTSLIASSKLGTNNYYFFFKTFNVYPNWFNFNCFFFGK